MTEQEYVRVASRGIAAGSLQVLQQAVEVFRMNAEVAGLRVNERVVSMNAILQEFSTEIYAASWDDREKFKS